jgi:hypothetical protein
VPVSWTFFPFFFNASAIFYTRWLLPVPADPKIKRLWPFPHAVITSFVMFHQHHVCKL